MFPVLRIVFLLIFVRQITATDITGVLVRCNDNDNITISVTKSNWNVTDVWMEDCNVEFTIKEFTLHKNCSSVEMDNFTFVTFRVNHDQNTTLAIQCKPAVTVYRIADGTEFTKYNMQFEVGDVDMSFKTGISAQSEEISKVYLGDQFYMIMEYIGKSQYTIVPQKCAVYEGNIASGKNVEIWNNINCVLDNGLTVMDNFNYTEDGRLYAKMYGFRFSGNGHNDITIKCDLMLCLPAAVTGGNTCNIKTCKLTRSYHKRTRVTSKRIQIIQDYRTENVASRHGTFSVLLITIFLPWLFKDQN